MAVWYLDNDDEITDAVARLRGTTDEQVVFVVPSGSRIATGRINFKLLAREAAAHGLAMAVASQDAQVRAMAASADVLAKATPSEAMAALERGELAVAPELAADETEGPTAQPGSGASPLASATGTSGIRTWRSQRMRLATLGVLVAVVVVAFLTTAVLPSATVTLTPRVTALGPLVLTVTASTDVSEPDAATGLVPAVTLPVRLETEITHRTGGTRVTETKATGSVVFSSLDQDSEQTIGEGTRVKTPADVEFRTTETVVLPARADGAPAQVTAAVEAVMGGEAGNVDAGRISVVPTLEGQGISVSNPEPTTGGRSDTSPLVEPGDYDDAVANLENLLAGQLKARVDDPAFAPEGLTVFAETRRLGPIALEPAPESVIGSAADEFTLKASVVAEVLAVDEQDVEALLRAALDAAVPVGDALVAGSARVSHAAGVPAGETITFAGTVSASASPLIDVETLVATIAGLPVSEAQAILDGLGTATVNVWPGFIGDLPNDRQRITLDVLEPSDTE